MLGVEHELVINLIKSIMIHLCRGESKPTLAIALAGEQLTVSTF